MNFSADIKNYFQNSMELMKCQYSTILSELVDKYLDDSIIQLQVDKFKLSLPKSKSPQCYFEFTIPLERLHEHAKNHGLYFYSNDVLIDFEKDLDCLRTDYTIQTQVTMWFENEPILLNAKDYFETRFPGATITGPYCNIEVTDSEYVEIKFNVHLKLI